MHLLEVNNLSKQYKDFKLEGINFKLERGYVMGLIGSNGSGKTTTLQLIMNLVRRDSGFVEIFGLDSIKDEENIKNRIGFVYDECPYFLNLNLKENAKLIAPFYTKWDQSAFESFLRRFDLDPKKKLSKLSKGMKMKFSLAMALSHHAELIIMDEPTSGLDPIFRREILDIFYDIMQEDEASLLFSTHITSDLDKIADYITFIDDGKMVFSKPMDIIGDSYRLIKGENDLLKKIPRDTLIGLRQTKYGFEALTENAEEIKERLSDSLLIENAVLEDIMYYYHEHRKSGASHA